MVSTYRTIEPLPGDTLAPVASTLGFQMVSGSAGMWTYVVALPAVQADFGVDRAAASLPYTLLMLGIVYLVTRYALVALSLWVVRFPFAEALLPYWGADAIWWSFPISMSVSAALALAYYRWGGWRRAHMGRTAPAAPAEAPSA